MEEKRIRRCKRCVNGCPVNAPKCPTGAKLAQTEGLYETVEEPVQKRSRLKEWLERHIPPKGI